MLFFRCSYHGSYNGHCVLSLPRYWPHHEGLPSQQAYSATADGGYVSHSDVEEEYAFEANLTADHDMDSEGEEISGTAAMESYAARTFIVKRVSSSQMGQAEQL